MIPAIAYCAGLSVRLLKPLFVVALAVVIARSPLPERLPDFGKWYGAARAYVVALAGQLHTVPSPPQRPKPDDAPADRRNRLVVQVNENNACLMTARVDGTPADFILDSGNYNSVALSRRTAELIGIDTSRLVYDRKIGTMGGTSWAARITLREVRIGKRVFRDVPADVVEGDINLLGMPVLRELGFRVTGRSCELGL
jgi:clan AA aspartic protease (TIGR02281 family)